ncbi:HupE/UreJ family protein [Kordiimonas aquimaris]|uniref:HupE/UreJ family protein n=1 Tax=Kordiimonas aquimaris TaxID=707591 RepID=UPI0021D1784E|nr:HupE/UreJ family protein [Kordiimonas aquimaris]
MMHILTKTLTALLFLAALSSEAFTHEGRPIYVEVTESNDGTQSIRWKIPPVLVSGNEPTIAIANQACQQIAGLERPTLSGSKIYNCQQNNDALKISLSYKGINPVLSTLVLYRRANGSEYSIMAGPEDRLITLPENETFARIAGQYTSSGFEHILEGYDHLLFVFCLVLLVGQFKRTLIAITGFTLGHSITLGMSALAQWSLPPTFVEPLIAFSVLILATEKASGNKQTLTHRHPTVIATGFGLLHGFGFGGALAEVGLPQTLQLQALAFFNIGVELGQALFVLVLFALYAIARPVLNTVQTAPSLETLGRLAIYPAGLMAGYWTVERVIGIWA